MHKFMIDPLNVKIDQIEEDPVVLLDLPMKPVNTLDIQRMIDKGWLLYSYKRGMIIIKANKCYQTVAARAIDIRNTTKLSPMVKLEPMEDPDITIYIVDTDDREYVLNSIQKYFNQDTFELYSDIHAITGGTDKFYDIKHGDILVRRKKC